MTAVRDGAVAALCDVGRERTERRVVTGIPAVEAGLLARLAALDSCAVSDALDGLGRPGALVGLAPLWPVPRVVVGRVRTLRVGPRQPGMEPTAHLGTPLLSSAAAGDVVVVDHGGRTDVSSWGGILSAAAVRAGVAGVVVDGACRDVGDSQRFGLPVWGRAVVPVSARGRVVQLGMDETVALSGVEVASGDAVVADDSGVVVVPHAVAETTVALAERIAAREADMLASVRAGRPVVDVMHDARFPGPEDVE